MAGSTRTWIDALLRPGDSSAHAVRLDLWYLMIAGVLLIGTGIGLRDPWPADEPRFALIARDMVANGSWFIPRVGGEIYADKPPFYFWLLACALRLTGSLRGAFLLPSLLTGLGCLWLVYDLCRRLWNREVGLAAGFALLFSIQFVWQARQAQIDATLCFFTTLSLYGLLRHLLLGPNFGSYLLGWAAAGIGVITKGVGFLPLLLLLPFAWLRYRQWRPHVKRGSSLRWMAGPLVFAAAISMWLIPVLWAARFDPAIAAYRDELLFNQTFNRYANAWHHREPFYYYFVSVIPGLWLPLLALLPWLVPRWRAAVRARDMRVALPLLFEGVVLLFFSMTAGKRGVYVLPAVPALAIACAPWLPELLRKVRVQTVLFVLSVLISLVLTAALVVVLAQPDVRTEVITTYRIDPLPPLMLLSLLTLAACALARTRRGAAAYAATITSLLMVVSFWINPVMNELRSGRAFVKQVLAFADPEAPLAIAGFREQFLLYMPRHVVHFGHARWREKAQEAADAALWLARGPEHQLVIDGERLEHCFRSEDAIPLGTFHRQAWYLLRHGAADPRCSRRGIGSKAQRYVPPRQPQQTE